jgi:hypothetical protein
MQFAEVSRRRGVPQQNGQQRDAPEPCDVVIVTPVPAGGDQAGDQLLIGMAARKSRMVAKVG